MFTGIVLERGRVKEAPAASGRGGRRLVIGHSPKLAGRLAIGASLAVDGVCLTVTELGEEHSVVELAPETLRRTALGRLAAGAAVNLEPALRVGDALGGHFMQGHVDGTVEVLEIRLLAEHREVAFALPAELEPYVVEKGSVAVDGVSLTVAGRAPGRFTVALIPHTLEVTTLGERAVGDRVHLEVDILAKYVEQALAARGLVGR